MNSRRSFLLAGVLLAMSLFANAQQMLVTGEWLQAQIRDNQAQANLVILHVGTDKDYAEGHIPGALLVTLDMIGIEDAQGLRLQVPPVADLEKTLGGLGIGDSSRVVIYAGNGLVQAATRVWFTFDYLGRADMASLLDGGLPLWKAQKRPVSTTATQPKTAAFHAKPRPETVVSLDWVKSHIPAGSVQLVDARTPEYYSGKDKGMMPRGGHIPGAKNVTFSTLLDESGRFQSPETLRSLMQVQEGKNPDALRVTYCHIGQQATLPYFVARMLGMDVKLFDGSFQEWSKREDLPVDTQ